MSERVLSPRLRQLLASRAPVIMLITPERVRGLQSVKQLSSDKFPLDVRPWNVVDGFGDADIVDAEAALTHVRRQAADERNPRQVTAWVFEDAHVFLEDPACNMLVKILHDELQRSRQSLVLMGTSAEGLVNGLDRMVETVRLDLPDKDELVEQLDQLGDDAPTGADRERCAQALGGLTLEQARLNIRRSGAVSGKADPDLLLQAKALTFRDQGLLDLLTCEQTLDDVGGCDILRAWIGSRLKALTPEGRKFVGRSPRGALFLGPPGSGKSLVSKAVAGTAGLPLLRLDMGKMFGSLVGQSEERMREALATAERVAPCVVQIDEVEKATAGVGSDGDSGVATRLFGQLLTWLQEHEADVFTLATSNGIENVPPELFRKGRFDEVWFLDLPTEVERADIFVIHVDRMARKGCGIPASDAFDYTKLAAMTEGFSGSEIEEVVVSALFDAFDQGVKEVAQEHLETAIKATVPLSVTAAERLNGLREWAKTRARFASSEAAKRLSGGRRQPKVLDASPALAGIVRLDDEGLN